MVRGRRRRIVSRLVEARPHREWLGGDIPPCDRGPCDSSPTSSTSFAGESQACGGQGNDHRRVTRRGLPSSSFAPGAPGTIESRHCTLRVALHPVGDSATGLQSAGLDEVVQPDDDAPRHRARTSGQPLSVPRSRPLHVVRQRRDGAEAVRRARASPSGSGLHPPDGARRPHRRSRPVARARVRDQFDYAVDRARPSRRQAGGVEHQRHTIRPRAGPTTRWRSPHGTRPHRGRVDHPPSGRPVRGGFPHRASRTARMGN